MTRTPPSDGQTWFEADAPADRPTRAEAPPRYTRVEQIGAGGMGTVHSAIDTELGRIVALKEAHDDPRLAARLEREARMTAALDHPGIVTVHDAGRGADGRPWYTMRLVRGESLGALLAREETLEGRLTLVRHLLDAAQAVAWAHSHTTVHRDLKPENIMIGEMGETQVVDWGLAVPFGTDTRVAGTPQYMSPQQAVGAPADPRDDVWSLGVVLYELLTASNPRGTGSVAELLARAAVPVPALPQGVPPELAAIVGKALQMAPADRYANAREFAADLARWIDGRPVLAHHYSPRELLLRAVRAYRLPLLVAAVALGAFLVLLGLFTWRTSWERDRATVAEGEARDALSAALSAHARSAFSTGAWPEAEVLAAEALLDREDPEARGVLAGLAAVRRPTLLADLEVPSCLRVQLGPDPSTVLCEAAGAVSLWEVDPPRERWSFPGVVAPDTSGARVIAEVPGGGYVVIDPADGQEIARLGRRGDLWRGSTTALLAGARGGQLVQLAVADGAVRPIARCAGNLGDARLLDDGRVLSVCAGGEVVVADPEGAVERRIEPVAPFIGPIAWNAPRASIVVLTPDGALWTIPPTGGAVRVGTVGVGTVVDVVLDRTGRFAAVVGGRAGVEVWDLDASARVLRLPMIGTRDVRLTADGNLVELGSRWRRWALPADLAAPAVPLVGGASAVAISPDGGEVAVGIGDGMVLRWGVGTGRRIEEWRCCEAAVKGLAYDGLRVVVAGGVRGLVRHGFDGVEEELGVDGFLRRIGVFADGSVIGLSTDDVVRAPGVAPQPTGVGENTELGASPRRTRIALVGGTGGVRILAPGDPVVFGPIILAHDAVTATVTDDGSVVYTGGPSGVRAWSAEGAPRWTSPHPAPYPVDLALSGDGRWVAAAGLDGAARVYRAADGLLVAVLRGHTARLSALVFAVDRPILATVGWDAQLRLWDLAALDLDAATAADRARTWWRMGRDDALAAVAR